MKTAKAILLGIVGGVFGAALMGIVLSQTIVTIHSGSVRIGGNDAPQTGIEVDIRKSISGGNFNVQIKNESDTANSKALVQVGVGGTSAGDPIYVSAIPGGSPSGYVWGQDNSDSDKWKLSRGASLGTNDVIVAWYTGTADQILIPDGSSSEPGLAFISDTNLGFKRNSSDSMTLRTGTENNTTWDTDGVLHADRVRTEDGIDIGVTLGTLGNNILFDGESTGDPAAPGADDAVLYTKDNGSGKTQLCVRFNTGAVQCLATEP